MNQLRVRSDIIDLTPRQKNALELKTGKRGSYTVAFKRNALRHFDITKSKSKTAFNLKISRSCLRDWEKDRTNIFDPLQKNLSRRVIDRSKKRKAFFHESENFLHNWY